MGRIALWLKASEGSDLLLLGLLGEEDSLNVWQDTTLGNGDSGEKFVELLVITDGELKMTGDDPGLLVITGSVASEFKNFSGQIFHDSCQVDWSTSTYTLSIVTLSQKSVDTTNWELKCSTGRSSLGLCFGDGLCFS